MGPNSDPSVTPQGIPAKQDMKLLILTEECSLIHQGQPVHDFAFNTNLVLKTANLNVMVY